LVNAQAEFGAQKTEIRDHTMNKKNDNEIGVKIFFFKALKLPMSAKTFKVKATAINAPSNLTPPKKPNPTLPIMSSKGKRKAKRYRVDRKSISHFLELNFWVTSDIIGNLVALPEIYQELP